MSTFVYVIEMLSADAVWEPTVGVALSRADARRERARWQSDNPHDEFQIVRYQRWERVR